MPVNRAEWLRDQLARRAWTTAVAADLSGIDVETLTLWLSDNDVEPTIGDLRKLAAVLGLPLLIVMVGVGALTEEEIERSHLPRPTETPRGEDPESPGGKIMPTRLQINVRRVSGRPPFRGDPPPGA